MVNVMLTDSMIDAGESLIRKLDERGVSPDAAFWIYFPDIQQWKLMLTEVKLGEKGPKELYKKIQDTIFENKNEIGELSLDDVALAKPDAPIVSLLRIAIRTGQGISGIRFTNNVINGTVIDDAYIYRLV
jgi:hypothetical protein